MPIPLVVTKRYEGQRVTSWCQPVTETNRDPNRNKELCDSTSNGTDQYQNGSSNLLTPYREQPRSTRIVVPYPRPAFSATKRTNYALTSFDQQVQVSQGHTSFKNKGNRNTEVHGGGGLELVKPVREPAPSRSKPCASLKKPHESCPFTTPCGPRRKKKRPWSDISFSLRNLPVQACDSPAQGFSPPLARRRSSCPPPSPNLVRTHPIENYQALRDSAPCLSRAATLPKGIKLELGRGAHLGSPSSANHTAAASQPTG